MKQVAMMIIRAYQKTLSPDHGVLSKLYPYGYCRFYPTCSEYGHECIRQHGLVKGGALTVKRIVRCNPFSAGGEDPVPEK